MKGFPFCSLRRPVVRAALSLVAAAAVVAALAAHRAGAQRMQGQVAYTIASSSWHLSETLFEAQRLALSLDDVRADLASLDMASQRLEILWSRVDLLLNFANGLGRLDEAVGADTRATMARIEAGLAEAAASDANALRALSDEAVAMAARIRAVWIEQMANGRYEMLTDEMAELRVRQTVSEIAIAVALLALLGHLAFELIMAQRALQRELTLRREAGAGLRARSDFLATVSHELRTPLNGILGLSALLSRDPVSARQQALVKGIQSSGALLLRRIEAMLDFVQICSGTYALQEVDITLGALAEEVAAPFFEAAEAKGLRLQTACQPDPQAMLRIDADALGKALRELMDNAVKFTATGGVTLRLSCDGRAGGGLRLRAVVEDSGVGLSGTDIHALFGEFIVGDASPGRRQGGVGLGLALAQGLVARLGGRMGATSAAGGGALFWIHAPAGSPAAVAAAGAEDRVATPSAAA
ncbi:sensor histidine kinase [Rubrimonas cliftonensis]|uniref:histidine kinase n=1 Tax=Rubrimonas cliftonensis TaxID=89524 RepID=A0A1H3YHZ0_9RHOB|nr:ATP-binding protein [Rubrimonas cliftonensis]SEA11210.1 hypothetical protein SAMN05444370_103110 [Rubrimonas cliftonensis]